MSFNAPDGGIMHSLSRAIARLLPLLAAPLVTLPVSAQVAQTLPPQPPPSISASAVGEAQIVPDRAMLSVAVESQGQSAAAAASANAAKQARVIDALKAAGVPAAQIRTSGYNVYPEYAQQSGQGPRVTGYRANNSVQIEVRSIDAVGKVIDAALGAGATNLGSLNLYASNPDPARREALQKAVAKARADAEAAATAAGGTLGALAELTIDPYNEPRPVMVQAMARVASAAQTPIEAGELVVQAVVRARWLFVPSQR
jgi:uncharacterized protein YggE